ncbi:hypothetical protein DFS34DRAFT_629853 [Phlyctochytrium arcticum]|nr:hypothetical protein DFS34DRAFT_629853 [Phlyctochytrium arcticum]
MGNSHSAEVSVPELVPDGPQKAQNSLDFGPAFVGPAGEGLTGGWCIMNDGENEVEGAAPQEPPDGPAIHHEEPEWTGKVSQKFGDEQARITKCVYDAKPQTPATTLLSQLHLRRNTIKLDRPAFGPLNSAHLSFHIDLSAPARIHINSNNMSMSTPYICQAGLEQDISLSVSLDHFEPNQEYSATIVLDTINEGADETTPLHDDFLHQRHITQLKFIDHGSAMEEKGNFEIKVGKQEVTIGNIKYALQEIYGLSPTSMTSTSDTDCAICLTETRDVAILPCRHMCLCFGCAEAIRMQGRGATAGRQVPGVPRCPICRTVIQSLLRITLPETYRRALSTRSVPSLNRSRQTTTEPRPSLPPARAIQPLPSAPAPSLSSSLDSSVERIPKESLTTLAHSVSELHHQHTSNSQLPQVELPIPGAVAMDRQHDEDEPDSTNSTSQAHRDTNSDIEMGVLDKARH